MALLGAAPVVGAVVFGHLGFGADGGGVEEELGALHGETAGGLGEPLVPADAAADFSDGGVEDHEAGVAGAEVEFLFVAGALGDVGLAVDAEHAAVGVHHGE